MRTDRPSAANRTHAAWSLRGHQSDIDLRGARHAICESRGPELAAVTLTSVRARPRPPPAVELTWTRFPGAEPPNHRSAAAYDSGARLPVDQLNLEFADPTDAASVTVRSRPDDSSDWIERHSGLFYSLTEANDRITSSPAQVSRTSDRYWVVETTREGGWREDRLPRLMLGWRPHELLFVAQGAGPYTLAYGSARVGATDAPVDALLASLDDSERADRIRAATLAAPRDLGGTEVLRPAPPWRRVFLWATLIGAVVVLAGFALRAFRDPANVKAGTALSSRRRPLAFRGEASAPVHRRRGSPSSTSRVSRLGRRRPRGAPALRDRARARLKASPGRPRVMGRGRPTEALRCASPTSIHGSRGFYGVNRRASIASAPSCFCESTSGRLVGRHHQAPIVPGSRVPQHILRGVGPRLRPANLRDRVRDTFVTAEMRRILRSPCARQPADA